MPGGAGADKEWREHVGRDGYYFMWIWGSGRATRTYEISCLRQTDGTNPPCASLPPNSSQLLFVFLSMFVQVETDICECGIAAISQLTAVAGLYLWLRA